MTDEELSRFLAKVDTAWSRGCWDWIGARNAPGYGLVTQRQRTRPVHRVAYEHWVGPIRANREIDHLCSNRSCVNPAHLESVTKRENIQRTIERGRHANPLADGYQRRTHCSEGHPFTASNTYIRKDGSRYCRACANEEQKARRRRRGLKRPAHKASTVTSRLYCMGVAPTDA